MTQVFISYFRRNRKTIKRLADGLVERGFDVYFDEKIEGGEMWKEEIEKGIKNGAFFICCLTEEYYNRKESYVKEELQIAAYSLMSNKKRQRLIPIKIKRMEIPNVYIGDGDYLSSIQCINFYEMKNWEEKIDAVERALKFDDDATDNDHTDEDEMPSKSSIGGTKTRVFEKIWYRSTMTSGLGIVYEYTGHLRIKPDSIDFIANKFDLEIPTDQITKISFKKTGIDVVNNWVIIEYGPRSNTLLALFSAGKYLGWAGGSDKIFEAVKFSLVASGNHDVKIG